MTSNYAERVKQADKLRSGELIKSLRDNAGGVDRYHYIAWARALAEVNEHITVPEEKIGEAAKAYMELGRELRRQLAWPDNAITVQPQGSVNTRTLIRAPDASKFDIDAVCQVDISRVQANDPLAFFTTIGDALRVILGKENPPEPGKRCWRILFPEKPFYIEFAPSVPLENVHLETRHVLNPRFFATQRYAKTALAVVDRPTKWWKTSNPQGFADWVNEIAKNRLIGGHLIKANVLARTDGVEPVPDQDVELSDTLRIAIRLFKRHRDMCARRQYIDGQYSPISIVIVTLLSSCYQGLADIGRVYSHPLELLLDLAELMPNMMVQDEKGYRIDNPTVEGENFAERWNDLDGGSERAKAFKKWCAQLQGDLRAILGETDDVKIREKTRDVFGCSHSTGTPGSGVKLTRKPPPVVVPTNGLA